MLWEAGQQPVPRTRYEVLVPACKTPGCNDIAEARDGFCDRCASDREYQASRELVASR